MGNDIASIYLINQEQYWLKVGRYYAMNFNSFEMEPHRHKEIEIMYVVSGRCKIICWKQNELNEYNIKEGEYIFIDCNVLHQLNIWKGVACRVLNLEIAIIPRNNLFHLKCFSDQAKSLQSFLKNQTDVFQGIDDGGNLHTIISELHKQLHNNMDQGENQIATNLLLAQFMIEIARQKTKKNRMYAGSKYIRRTHVYLENHYEQKVTVNEIANEIGISVAYLQRLFKEKTGKSLIEKTNEFRIEKAKILLETSSLPITDIAINVGFNNRQHFSFTFSKIAGCSPSIYRKQRGNYRLWEGF